MSKTSHRLFGLYLVAVCADLARIETETGGYVRVFGSKKPGICDKVVKEVSQLRVPLSSRPSRLRLLGLSRRVSLRDVSRVPLGCLSCVCLLGCLLGASHVSLVCAICAVRRRVQGRHHDGASQNGREHAEAAEHQAAGSVLSPGAMAWSCGYTPIPFLAIVVIICAHDPAVTTHAHVTVVISGAHALVIAVCTRDRTLVCSLGVHPGVEGFF